MNFVLQKKIFHVSENASIPIWAHWTLVPIFFNLRQLIKLTYATRTLYGVLSLIKDQWTNF